LEKGFLFEIKLEDRCGGLFVINNGQDLLFLKGSWSMSEVIMDTLSYFQRLLVHE